MTPAAEPLSFELTIAIVKDARSGLSMYAKKERIISSEAAHAVSPPRIAATQAQPFAAFTPLKRSHWFRYGSGSGASLCT